MIFTVVGSNLPFSLKEHKFNLHSNDSMIYVLFQFFLA